MPPWALALAITLALEVPLVAALFPGQRVKMALVSAAANTATNLTLNLLLPTLFAQPGSHILPGEILAVVVETEAYALASRPRDLSRSLLASSLANALSYSAAMVPFVSAALLRAGARAGR
jgi:hypothetical protein